MAGGAPERELLSIIVPVFNEARTVGAVVDRLLSIPVPVLREILVVNDGSTAGTGPVFDAIAPRPGLTIIHAEANADYRKHKRGRRSGLTERPPSDTPTVFRTGLSLPEAPH